MSRAYIHLAMRKLARAMLLLAAVALLSFALGSLAPGRFEDGFRLDAGYSRDAVAAIRERHGLDAPWPRRFAWWLASAARGEFGTSIEYDMPAGSLVAVRAARTLLLGSLATLLAWLVAVPLGLWTATRADSMADRACRAATAAALAVPEPVLALALMLAAARTAVLPAGGMLPTRFDAPTASSFEVTTELIRHLIIPTTVLACALAPALLRHVRASVLDTLRAPFIVAARARGVGGRRLLYRCTLRASAAPLAALFGLSIGNLLSASLLVEVITGWPGLGPLLVEAVRARDIPVVAAATFCSTLFLVGGMLIGDLLLAWADPRVAVSAQTAASS